MSASQRNKGARYENDVVQFLRANGYPGVERRYAGAPNDRGDITGWPGVVIDAKNRKQFALSTWVDQLEAEIGEVAVLTGGPAPVTGALIVKRKGHVDVARHYVVMTVDRWLDLMKAAGW